MVLVLVALMLRQLIRVFEIAVFCWGASAESYSMVLAVFSGWRVCSAAVAGQGHTTIIIMLRCSAEQGRTVSSGEQLQSCDLTLLQHICTEHSHNTALISQLSTESQSLFNSVIELQSSANISQPISVFTLRITWAAPSRVLEDWNH